MEITLLVTLSLAPISEFVIVNEASRKDIVESLSSQLDGIIQDAIRKEYFRLDGLELKVESIEEKVRVGVKVMEDRCAEDRL